MSSSYKKIKQELEGAISPTIIASKRTQAICARELEAIFRQSNCGKLWQWLWLSWLCGCLLLQRSEVRILSSANILYWTFKAGITVQIHSKTCPSKRCVEKIKITKKRPVWAHFLLENCGKLFLLYSISGLDGRRICYLDRKTIQAIARAIADAKRFKILSLSLKVKKCVFGKLKNICFDSSEFEILERK